MNARRFLVMLLFVGAVCPANAQAEPQSISEAVDAGAALWETTERLVVRSIPHARGRAVVRLAKGVPVVVLLERGEWYKVLAEGEKRGWVESPLLRKVSDGRPTRRESASPAERTPRDRGGVGSARPAEPAVASDRTLLESSPSGPSEKEDGESAPKPSPSDRFVTPLDFCATTTATSTTKFVRQKVVLFRLTRAPDAKISGPGSQRCLEHAADLFQAVFPMKRFDNVVSPTTVPDVLKASGHVDLGTIKSTIASESPFAGYSLGCADYVAVPVLTECVGKWETVKDKKGRTRRVYDAKIEARLVIWRRKGPDLVHHETVDAYAPTIANRASDLAQAAQASVTSAVDQVGGASKLLNLLDPLNLVEVVAHISPTPDNTCVATGKRVADDPGCKVSVNQTVVPFAQPIAELRKCLAEPPNDDAGRMRCGIRNRAEQLAFNLQKGARGVDGWRLWAALVEVDGKPTMSLGKAEGVYVGEVFHAVRRAGGTREVLGHTKVLDVGAGGDDGAQASKLRWRAGEATGAGVILEEHPQLGLSVAVAGQLNTLLVPALLAEPSKGRFFDPGTFYPGASLEVGYDLSGKIGWPEFWLATHMAFVMSPGEAISTMLFDVQVFAEKRFYLGRRLDWFFGVGPSMVVAALSLHKIEGVPEDTSVSAFTVGIAAETGFDLVLTADLYLRLGVMWRQHFKPIEEFTLEDEQVWKPGAGFTVQPFSTTYSGLAVHLGAGWVF